MSPDIEAGAQPERPAQFRRVTGREAVAAILAARYDEPAGDATDRIGECTLVPHQLEGSRRLARSLDRWRVALLADDVGMGKTFTAIAAVARLGGPADVLFVVPAAVRSHWSTRLRQAFGAAARAARILTHGQLSRSAGIGASAGLVVVDESHAFRNPNTQRYRALARTCAGTRVLLVSATPIVNALLDLYFQLRLCIGDGAFDAIGVDDLRALFRSAAASPRAPPAAFRRLMRELATARNREIFGPDERRRLGFPHRLPNRRVGAWRAGEFELRPLLAGIAELQLPWFAPLPAPGRADRAQPRGDSRALLRMMLLKRLDSSLAAFAASVERLETFNLRALTALADGVLLTPRAAGPPTAGRQLTLDALLGLPLPAGVDTQRLAAAAAADREQLARLRTAAVAAEEEPKIRTLWALLAADGRKTIVFTAYRDSAEAIWRELRERLRTALLHGSGGALGTDSASRSTVIRSFAPVANGAREPPPARQVAVLVATDSVSEGLNLQDAARVISFDLPWNPFRLQQRAGRIDRLGCPHDAVESILFLPDPELDAELRILARLERKQAAAAAAVSARNARPESRAPGDARRSGTADARDAGRRVRGWLVEEERLRRLAARLTNVAAPPRDATALACFDGRDGAVPERHSIQLLAVVGAGPDQSFWVLRERANWRLADEAAAARILERASSQEDAGVHEAGRTTRMPYNACDWIGTQVCRLENTLRRHGDGDTIHDRFGRSARALEVVLARRLRSAIITDAAAGDSQLAERADVVLQMCRRGFDAATERRIRSAIRHYMDAPTLLQKLEDALAPAQPRPGSRAHDAHDECAAAKLLPPANPKVPRTLAVLVNTSVQTTSPPDTTSTASTASTARRPG